VVTGVAAGEADITATFQGIIGNEHIAVTSATLLLSGTVTDGTSGGILPNVTINVADGPSAGKSTTSDRAGNYSIADMLPGTMTVVATAVSYQTTQNRVTLSGDTRVDFVLARVSPAVPPPATVQCDPLLWNHVHDVNRLQVRATCITVTGVVTDLHPNDDGDYDIRLAVDPAYSNLLNSGNISNLNGHLQTEAICQAPVQPTVTDAVRACTRFTGTVPIPAVGAHVQVTGTYVLDKEHGWMEVHPITLLTVR
jgi:hypothetical protein